LYYNNWRLHKKGYRFDEVNQDIVNEYISDLVDAYSHNSLVPHTCNLKKLLVLFLDKDIKIKLKTMKSPQRDKTPFTREEVQRMFTESADDPLAHAVLKILYYAGLRKSELINLDVDDVDFARMQLVIRAGKGKRFRLANISGDCTEAIKRYLVHRPTPKEGHEKALFLSPSRQRISSCCLSGIVKNYAAKPGIEKPAYPHKFRITMITEMAEHGCSLKEIQPQSGHRNVGTLLGYMQHRSSRIRQTYDAVFEREKVADTPKDIEDVNEDHLKKQIVRKYLDGELTEDMMSSLLKKLGNNTDSGNSDIAYI